MPEIMFENEHAAGWLDQLKWTDEKYPNHTQLEGTYEKRSRRCVHFAAD
jgi:hypothetical protein